MLWPLPTIHTETTDYRFVCLFVKVTIFVCFSALVSDPGPMTAVCGATGLIASKAAVNSNAVPMQFRNTTGTERLEVWIPEVVSSRGPSRPILLSGVWPRRQFGFVEKKMEWGIPVVPLTQRHRHPTSETTTTSLASCLSEGPCLFFLFSLLLTEYL